MPVTKLTITKAVVINLGDYQNERAEVSLEHTLEPGETLEQAYAATSAQVKGVLAAEVVPVVSTLSSWKRDKWFEVLGVEQPQAVVEPSAEEESAPQGITSSADEFSDDSDDDDLGDTGDDDDDRPTEEDFERAGDLDADDDDDDLSGIEDEPDEMGDFDADDVDDDQENEAD